MGLEDQELNRLGLREGFPGEVMLNMTCEG